MSDKIINKVFSRRTSGLRLTPPGILCLIVLVILVFTSSGSSSCDRRSTTMQGNNLSGPAQSSDDELMSLVRQIAAGSDENSDAWRTLAAIPRGELISRLQTITQRLDSTDRRRISIAFVFCLLGHDYESNRDLIVKDMVRESNPDSDWELELIHRLISRGDSSLLPALFKMVPRADGAMAAALSGYLTYHVRNQPEQFLLGLKPQTKQLRMAVYWSLMHDELLTEADLATIRRHLESIPKANPTFAVAREMLSTLRRGQRE